MIHLKSHPMTSPSCYKLVEGCCTALIETELYYLTEQYEDEEILPVTEDQLIEACSRLGIPKASGLDGTANSALNVFIKAAA